MRFNWKSGVTDHGNDEANIWIITPQDHIGSMKALLEEAFVNSAKSILHS